MARRRAREIAFQTLFQAQQGQLSLDEVWHDIRTTLGDDADEADEPAVYGAPLDPEGLVFAEQLITLYKTHQEAVDTLLADTIEGWDFKQMAQTDLNVLRIATTELLYQETPREVVIEVAVRIAKKFGGEESGRFVNGVLAKLQKPTALSGPS